MNSSWENGIVTNPRHGSVAPGLYYLGLQNPSEVFNQNSAVVARPATKAAE